MEKARQEHRAKYPWLYKEPPNTIVSSDRLITSGSSTNLVQSTDEQHTQDESSTEDAKQALVKASSPTTTTSTIRYQASRLYMSA
jgi:hypothetical protein